MHWLYLALKNHPASEPPTEDEIAMAQGQKALDPTTAADYLLQLEKASSNVAQMFAQQSQQAAIGLCLFNLLFAWSDESVGRQLGSGEVQKITCWVDCGLWSAIWGGWAAWILMPAWVHPFAAITSYPQPIYHESANHEDGRGHPYGCKAAHSGTLIVFTNLVETSWHFLFSRTWTARSASRLMLGHLAINMGFSPLLCTISTQTGNVVSHN